MKRRTIMDFFKNPKVSRQSTNLMTEMVQEESSTTESGREQGVLEHIKRLKKDTMPKCIIQLNERQISTTCKVFRTVYSIAKRNLPFAQVTKSIELQMLNGVDMGVGLHSRQTAVSIVDGIATDQGHTLSILVRPWLFHNQTINVYFDLHVFVPNGVRFFFEEQRAAA